MTLKKSYSAGFCPVRGKIREQRDVDMHPFEESAHRAQWLVGEKEMNLPRAATHQEELDMLIEHGVEYVKQKRAEFATAWQTVQNELGALTTQAQQHWARWNDHAHKAVANGFDADTHPDARGLTISEEKK